jgi:hypothetical protein
MTSRETSRREGERELIKDRGTTGLMIQREGEMGEAETYLFFCIWIITILVGM